MFFWLEYKASRNAEACLALLRLVSPNASLQICAFQPALPGQQKNKLAAPKCPRRFGTHPHTASMNKVRCEIVTRWDDADIEIWPPRNDAGKPLANLEAHLDIVNCTFPASGFATAASLEKVTNIPAKDVIDSQSFTWNVWVSNFFSVFKSFNLKQIIVQEGYQSWLISDYC